MSLKIGDHFSGFPNTPSRMEKTNEARPGQIPTFRRRWISLQKSFPFSCNLLVLSMQTATFGGSKNAKPQGNRNETNKHHDLPQTTHLQNRPRVFLWEPNPRWLARFLFVSRRPPGAGRDRHRSTSGASTRAAALHRCAQPSDAHQPRKGGEGSGS